MTKNSVLHEHITIGIKALHECMDALLMYGTVSSYVLVSPFHLNNSGVGQFNSFCILLLAVKLHYLQMVPHIINE